MNFGIKGTGSQQHYSLLEERILQYAPDLVVLGYCLNDIRFSPIYDRPVLMWLLRRSNFADFLAIRVGGAIWKWQFRVGSGSPDYYIEHLRLYEDKERILKLKDVLREMKVLLSGRGIRFAVVVFPFRQQLGQQAFIRPQTVLADICRGEGIPFLDTRKELIKHHSDELYLPGDSMHFSSYGNKVVAESIMEFLRSDGLI